jgi:ATP-dependent Clp endopeptidase proteolytic subunit ClpP
MPQLNKFLKKKPGKGEWYSMSAKESGSVEVFIYDEIGIWGIGAEAFVKDLRAYKGRDISLRMNTPGGSVFDGAAIYNALKSHTGRVTTEIDGLAASIGSVIALAGESVKMAKNAFFMIHDPWGIMIGNADEMRKTAELLDKIKGTMANTYVEKTGMELKKINALMNDETWYTAQEAKDAGFADEIGDEMKIAASFDLSNYEHAPQGLAGNAVPFKPKDERELEGTLHDLGYSRSEARAVVARGYKGLGRRDADAGAKIGLYELIHTIRA